MANLAAASRRPEGSGLSALLLCRRWNTYSFKVSKVAAAEQLHLPWNWVMHRLLDCRTCRLHLPLPRCAAAASSVYSGSLEHGILEFCHFPHLPGEGLEILTRHPGEQRTNE